MISEVKSVPKSTKQPTLFADSTIASKTRSKAPTPPTLRAIRRVEATILLLTFFSLASLLILVLQVAYPDSLKMFRISTQVSLALPATDPKVADTTRPLKSFENLPIKNQSYSIPSMSSSSRIIKSSFASDSGTLRTSNSKSNATPPIAIFLTSYSKSSSYCSKSRDSNAGNRRSPHSRKSHLVAFRRYPLRPDTSYWNLTALNMPLSLSSSAR